MCRRSFQTCFTENLWKSPTKLQNWRSKNGKIKKNTSYSTSSAQQRLLYDCQNEIQPLKLPECAVTLGSWEDPILLSQPYSFLLLLCRKIIEVKITLHYDDLSAPLFKMSKFEESDIF